MRAGGRIDGAKRVRLPGKLLRSPLDVELRMLARPRMIERGMVADEIEKESHASLMELLADKIEIAPRADARIGNVGGNGIGRGDHVFGSPARKSAAVERRIIRVRKRKASRLRAALPDAHEPDDVEAAIG